MMQPIKVVVRDRYKIVIGEGTLIGVNSFMVGRAADNKPKIEDRAVVSVLGKIAAFPLSQISMIEDEEKAESIPDDWTPTFNRRDIVTAIDSQLLFVVLKVSDHGDIYCSCNQAGGSVVVHRTFNADEVTKVGELTEEQFTSMDYHTYKR